MTKSPPTTVFLLRHGQTVNTLDGKFRYNGHIDVEVTDESLETMRSIARQLEAKHITHIYSSNLRRSQAGATMIADQLELPLTPLCRALQMAATNIFRLKQDFCCVNQLDYYHDFVQVNLVNSPCLP